MIECMLSNPNYTCEANTLPPTHTEPPGDAHNYPQAVTRSCDALTMIYQHMRDGTK